MTSQISIQDARNNFADLVAQTALIGRQFVITKFGKPTAMLGPITVNPANQRDAALDATFGAWKDRKDIKNSARWVAKIRRKMSLRQR